MFLVMPIFRTSDNGPLSIGKVREVSRAANGGAIVTVIIIIIIII